MGFLDPYDYNHNGKVDDEDWFLEELDRKRTEELWKKREEDRKSRFPEPPPTEEETRQGIRAWVTLGICAPIFFFFMMADMIGAALFGTLAVMLVLIIFYVKPWPSKTEDEKKADEERNKNISAEEHTRYKREKSIFFSVIGAIILIPLSIWLIVWMLPPVSFANIEMTYSDWSKHYKNGTITIKVNGENNRYQCSSFHQKVFGVDATVTYFFNRSDKLEYIEITPAEGKEFSVEDQLRINRRIKLRYRSPDIEDRGSWVWRSRNYELLDLYYGNELYVIQPRGYYYNEKSFEKAFQLMRYEYRWRSEEYYAQKRLEDDIRANAERESRRQEQAAQKETTTKGTKYY